MKWSKGLFGVLFGSMLVLMSLSYFVSSSLGPHTVPLRIEGKKGTAHSFDVEIAATPEQQEQGLMFRKRMEPDHGMLFEMGKPRVIRFWMKDTLIPLDMLFIGEDGAIKKIQENAVPKSLTGISSSVPVTGVLELNGGRARELGIAVGDKVIHPYFTKIKPSAKSE